MESNNHRVPATIRLAIILCIAAILSLAGCVPEGYRAQGERYTKQQKKAMKAIARCPAHLRK